MEKVVISSNFLGELKQSAFKSSAAFLQVYLENESDIINSITRFNGIKSEYYCHDLKGLKEVTKFLSVFSDFTSIYTMPGSRNTYKIDSFNDNSIHNIERNVNIPPSLLNSSLTNGYNVVPSYMYKNNEDIREMMLTLSPFIDKGQFLVRPMRTLMVKSGNVQHDLFYAYSDTPIDKWEIKEANEQKSYTIDNSLKQFQSDTLLELTIPYFQNVSLSTLSKILDDESDTISQFRAALNALVNDLPDDKADIKGMQNDIIRPQLEELNRKFRTISNLHKLSVAGSVSVFTLSLVGALVSDSVNFKSLFSTMLAATGVAGLGFLASEIRYQQEQDKLKDKPLYLLWRINRAKS